MVKKSIIVEGKEFNFKNGISFIKTKYSENYDEIPESLKHSDIKKLWKRYPKVPEKLVTMSKSQDKETLELVMTLLDDLKVEYNTTIGWTSNYSKQEIKSITLFKSY